MSHSKEGERPKRQLHRHSKGEAPMPDIPLQVTTIITAYALIEGVALSEHM